MATGINFPLVANVAGFIRGTDDVEAALDDVADSLDDLGQDGKDVGQDLGRDLGNGADDAAEAGDDLEKRFRRSLDGVTDASKAAGDDVGRNLGDGVDEGTARISEGTEQMRDDATANATEMAASFDGSVGSMTDAAQGFISEGLAGFGPAGAIAGMGVAIGMGVATSAMEKSKEEAQEAAEEIAGIASELIGLGKGGNVRATELINDRLKEMATTAEEGQNELLGLKDTADELGLGFSDLARGMAGDSDAAARSIAEINAEMNRLGDINNENAGAAYNSATGKANSERRETINLLKEQREAIADANGVLDEGTEVYEAYNDVIDDGSSALVAQNEAIEANNEAKRESANAALEASNAEIGFAAAVQDTTETIATNGATLDLNTEAGRANKSALNDLASETLGLADANKVNGAATADSNAKMATGRQAFLNAAEAAGMAADEASALADSYGLVPETVSTAVTVTGTAQAKTDLDGVTAPRTVPISPFFSNLQGDVDRAFAGLRAPVVTPKAQFGQQVK